MKALIAALLFVPAAASAESIAELLEKLADRKVETPVAVHGRPDRHRRDDRRDDDRDEERYRRSGREAALQACEKVMFRDDKQACIALVSRSDYFDAEAVGACKGMVHIGSVTKCIGAVADKEYVSAEVRACRSPFEDDFISCLASTGRAYARRPRWERRPDLDSYILNRLRRIKRELDDGNTLRALAYLTELLSYVEDGMEGRL